MKIKSEYNLIADCVERGVLLGYNRAYKHTDVPSESGMQQAIADAIMLEISEMFIFDKEHYE